MIYSLQKETAISCALFSSFNTIPLGMLFFGSLYFLIQSFELKKDKFVIYIKYLRIIDVHATIFLEYLVNKLIYLIGFSVCELDLPACAAGIEGLLADVEG